MCALTLSLARAVRWLGASVFENFGVDAATRDETLSSSETARLAAVLSSHRLSPARNDRRFPNQNQASNCWCVLRSRVDRGRRRPLTLLSPRQDGVQRVPALHGEARKDGHRVPAARTGLPVRVPREMGASACFLVALPMDPTAIRHVQVETWKEHEEAGKSMSVGKGFAI